MKTASLKDNMRSTYPTGRIFGVKRNDLADTPIVVGTTTDMSRAAKLYREVLHWARRHEKHTGQKVYPELVSAELNWETVLQENDD
jgi:hypothetical protein